MSFGNSSISKICYNYIKEILPEGKAILELGSGFGTGELAKDYKMISIEHDGRWIEQYESDYIYAPIKFYDDEWKAPNIPGNEGWFSPLDVQRGLEGKKYDLILVDGPPGYPNYNQTGKRIGRAGFLKHINLFNTSVPIIVDDIDRDYEMMLLEELSKHLNKPYKILEDKSVGVII